MEAHQSVIGEVPVGRPIGRPADECFSIDYILQLVYDIEEEVYQMMKDHRDSGHGYDHIIKVTELAFNATTRHEPELSIQERVCVVLAAYLHEVDDKKLFNTENYTNARRLLEKLQLSNELRETVVNMISIVSCSANGNAPVEPKWMAIPRDADRIFALGHEGIRRCYDFSVSRGAVMYTSATPRPKTLEEMRALPRELFDQYMANGKSASMMDHYADKLLWIGQMSSGNKFLQDVADCKMHCIEMYYWCWCISGEIIKPDVWDKCCKAMPHREKSCELVD